MVDTQRFKSILAHHSMLADSVRMAAYERAIRETVAAGDVVADIGTGSGVLAFMALKAGARRVYAVEKTRVVREAEKIAAKNGFQDRVVFFHERSDRVELPERVDVVTSELIGYFGLEENLNAFQIDARKRFLKPQGALVPSSLELHLTPVESGILWNRYVGLWSEALHGIDYSNVGESAANQRYVIDCSGAVLEMAPPARAGEIDFFQTESIPTRFAGKFTLERDGSLDGMLGHFEAQLSPSVRISSGVGAPSTHWNQSFFPLPARVPVQKGDRVEVAFKAIPYGEEVYWEWQVDVLRDKGMVAHFNQTNFHLTMRDLLAGRQDFQPELNEEGHLEKAVLELVDGQRTLAEIGGAVLKRYPNRFGSLKEATAHAGSLIRRVARID